MSAALFAMSAMSRLCRPHATRCPRDARPMYITDLEMDNFACFRHIEAKLHAPGSGQGHSDGDPHTPDNITLIMGDNGMGKTSVLRALAVVTMGRLLARGDYALPPLIHDPVIGGLEPFGNGPPGAELLQGGPELAEVRAQVLLHAPHDMAVADAAPLRAKWRQSVRKGARGETETLDAPIATYGSSKESLQHMFGTAPGLYFEDQLSQVDSAAYLVLGYGGVRVRADSAKAPSPGSAKDTRYRRIAGLFSSATGLFPLSAWLPGSERRAAITDLVDQMLPGPLGFSGRGASDELAVRTGRAEVPLTLLPSGLPGGLQAYIDMVGDILYHLDCVTPAGQAVTETTGVVLIDAVDAQLYGPLQAAALQLLPRTLDKLQFVVTSGNEVLAAPAGPVPAEQVVWLANQTAEEATSMGSMGSMTSLSDVHKHASAASEYVQRLLDPGRGEPNGGN